MPTFRRLTAIFCRQIACDVITVDGVYHDRQHGGGKILPMKISKAPVITNNTEQKASALDRWRKARIQTKVAKVVGNMLVRS